MDVLIITIESDDLNVNDLMAELITARDHEEGVTIRTGGGVYPVDVIGVSQRSIPALREGE